MHIYRRVLYAQSCKQVSMAPMANLQLSTCNIYASNFVALHLHSVQASCNKIRAYVRVGLHIVYKNPVILVSFPSRWIETLEETQDRICSTRFAFTPARSYPRRVVISRGFGRLRVLCSRVAYLASIYGIHLERRLSLKPLYS